MFMLPNGFEYEPGSATVDGAKVTDSKNQVIGAGDAVVSLMDGVLVARLGELPAGAVHTIRFETRSTSRSCCN